MTAIAFESLAQVAATLQESLRLRGERQPDTVAYVFLRDGEAPEEMLTYRQLGSAARARGLPQRGGLGGGAAVLLYPSGLEFVSTLLACMYAGIAGAPVQVPTRRSGMQRVRRIADDAGTSTMLTTSAVKRELEESFGGLPELAGLTLLGTESMRDFSAGDWAWTAPGPDGIALLQYTSGSTGDPKGVEVTHANFRSSVAETVELWPVRSDGTVVNWLPLFHDMGLMFGVVMPLWSGIPAYLMAPQAFIRRPARWLEAISWFRGTHAAAPSFAYERCVRSALDAGLSPGLDLSSWRVAVNGAEPVRWATVRAFTQAYAPAGFRPQAMCPGYGLAENTLKLSGGPEDREPTLLCLDAEALQEGRVVPLAGSEPGGVAVVGCGVTVGSSHVSVADPATGTAQPADRVGEIWINGPCVARGYHGGRRTARRSSVPGSSGRSGTAPGCGPVTWASCTAARSS